MRLYKNFDVELANYRSDDREYVTVRVLASPVGGQRQNQAEEVAFPERLRRLIPELKRRRLDFDGMISLGEAIAELLLPAAARGFLRRSMAALKGDEGLRIRIRTDTPELAELPWEYAYVASADTPSDRKDESDFLALNLRLSLVRYEVLDRAAPAKPGEPSASLRIGAVLADVIDPGLARLELDREELVLRQSLDNIRGVEISVVRPGTLTQFEELLSTRSVQVFHFAGHGEFSREMGEQPGVVEGRGSLIFAGDENRPDPLDAAQLALNLSSRGVQLAVLGACEAAMRDSVSYWSGVAPALIRNGVPVVVGMQYTVRDANAVAFARRFYRALANGQSIDAAVCEGRLGILTREGGRERDWGAPVLYLQTDLAVLFPEPVGPVRRNLLLAVATSTLISSWFFLHIYPALADSASRVISSVGIGAGAVAGLIAFLQLLASVLTRESRRRKTESVVSRMLRARLADRVLWPVFVVALLLSATTTSIYFDLDRDDVESMELDVLAGEELRWSPLPKLSVSLTENRLRAGGPVFLQVPPTELQLQVASPPDWEVKSASRSIQPRPWRSARIDASSDLSKLELRPVRLAARANLMEFLPPPSAEPADTRYSLRIKIGDEPWLTLEDDLRQGLVYAGGRLEDLTHIYDQESEAARLAALRPCVVGTSVEAMLEYWQPEIKNYRHTYPTPGIRSDQSLTIEIIRTENDVEAVTVASKIIKADAIAVGRISTICISRLVGQP